VAGVVMMASDQGGGVAAAQPEPVVGAVNIVIDFRTS